MFWYKLKHCLLLLFLPIFLVFAEDDDVDYCNLNDCSDEHIACNNYGEVGPECPKDVRFASLIAHKQYILGVFNELRNEIATGELEPFQQAHRMATMQWNSDLADLASLRTMRCTKRPDECFGTELFESPGQGAIWFIFDGKDNVEYFDRAVKKVFRDVVNARFKFNAEWASAMPVQQANPIVGHFALIIRDNNAFIGCAASISTENDEIRLLLVCNFSYKNIVGYPVYKAGPTAKGCKTGSNQDYKGLCSTKEVYDFSKMAKRKG